ncbi:MAG TPA: hypothetical protein VFU71_12170 [Burkholderiaceae bacterium]|nr:hypothetical protein [Burkholderiaceae bacterium]
MNTVTQAFDSRAMPLLSEPTTAPSAFSLWRWLGDRLSAKLSAQHEANLLRDHANELMDLDPRFANDLRAAADQHEQRFDH